jgi:hypothetical protein
MATAAGIDIEAGHGFALIFVGAMTVVYFLLLYDTDERRDSDESPTAGLVDTRRHDPTL